MKLLWLAGATVASAVVLPVLALLTAVGALAPSSGSAPVAAIPPAALAAYTSAAPACPGLSWTVIAGIGEVESDHGRSNLPGVHSGANSAGAEGPMQFLPATFAAYAVGPHASPYDLNDAALAAARLLCADGAADPARLRAAVWDYNHSWGYVDTVLAWANRYAAGEQHATSQLGLLAAVWALDQLGLPYVWGAAGPDVYDCSGLVMRAWEAVGVTLPRVAAAQYAAGSHVPLSDAQIGDLVFFATDPSDPTTIHHVGMFAGGGMMIDAPDTGGVVEIVPIYPSGLVSLVMRPGPD